jgi:hypothetical protein
MEMPLRDLLDLSLEPPWRYWESPMAVTSCVSRISLMKVSSFTWFVVVEFVLPGLEYSSGALSFALLPS